LDGVAGEINEKQKHFLDLANRNINRLALLINDVLDFQKLSSGKILFNLQEHDITETTEETHRVMVALAKNEGVALSIKLEDNLPRASFDRDKIIQVLMNLISNAIKFTPKGGKVSVTVRCQGEELVICVSDTGRGIPKEALPKIFEQFYRVQQPGKEIQGTGLGLAIVKKIIMAHGGRIEVESEVGRGTTFSVFLPLTDGPPPQVLPKESDELLESHLADNKN
jgi:signal transduction histidine kinase